jgi:16S rRNA (guanine966-N2)-methyltransferase
MMNIVSGMLRGLPLRAPAGMTTRPTSVRARKALFDSLGDLTGKTVADLFAGSGAIGLEAASRGAGTVWFADSSAGAIRCIKANTAKAAELGCNARFEIVNISLPSGANRLSLLSEPDLVFADPPYAETLDYLSGLLNDPAFTGWCRNAVLIWEIPADRGLVPPPKEWTLAGIRIFGGAKFAFFRRNTES